MKEINTNWQKRRQIYRRTQANKPYLGTVFTVYCLSHVLLSRARVHGSVEHVEAVYGQYTQFASTQAQVWAFAAFCSGRCSAFQHLWTPGSWHPWHDNCTVLSVKSFFWAGSFIAGTRLLPLPRRFLPVSVGLGSNSPWIGWYWQKNAMGRSVGRSVTIGSVFPLVGLIQPWTSLF